MMVKLKEEGFTLFEVMLVVVILAMLAMVAVPRLGLSAENARQKADIMTGKEVKSALDRYQVDKGAYPKISEVGDTAGKITCTGLIPEYIAKLEATTTQQKPEAGQEGFSIADFDTDWKSDFEPERLITLFLTTDGSAAEVRVYDRSLDTILWSSI